MEIIYRYLLIFKYWVVDKFDTQSSENVRLVSSNMNSVCTWFFLQCPVYDNLMLLFQF